MKNALRHITSLLLCIAVVAGFMLVGTLTSDELPKVEAANHGVYDTLTLVKDHGSCPSMQGLALCGDYFYAIKTDGNDYGAAVCRVHKDTGSMSWLSNSGNSTDYFYDFGHGNDLDVVVAGGVTTMLVATSNTGSNSLVRYKISGTTATKVAGYKMVSTSGANIGGGAIRVARVDSENMYLLFKSGSTMYTAVLPISQTSGTITMTTLCKLDYSTAYVNGVATDLTGWSLQGMGYHDHMLYLPVSSHTTTSKNMSIILVYDLEGASGTIKPLPDPTFKITSSTYSALFEVESCVINPANNLLYFNTNRRKTTSDTNHDGIHFITNWTYEPQNRTTEVNNYRWEMTDDRLLSVTDDGAVYNGLALHQGSVSGGTITNGRYAMSKTVVLEADKPWVLEWKSNGSAAGELLFATQAVSNYQSAPYIFVNGKNARVSIGYHDGTQYNNYGVTLADHGIDGNQTHVFRLTNKPASGSNMVYLSVDGRELGPMNNYHIASTSQGTTSDWVSGQDFRFSYLGTSKHPVNDSIEYIQVWGNGIINQVDEPDTYRWETTGNALTNISKFDMTENGTSMLWGSVSGTTYTGAQYDLNRNVVLLHNRPWSVEWKGSYSSGAMLLAGDNNGNTEGAPYLYRSGILAFGERLNGTHNNYGLKLSDYGISYSDTHVFRLTNRIADDGSNMVYLYVDGEEIAPMNQYFKGTTAQGTTVNWINGRDLTFTHLGAYNYFVAGSMEYLQIWEDGIPAENDPKNFYWQAQDDQMANITSDGYSSNEATLLGGTISGGSFTQSGYLRLEESVVLTHDRPWSVCWQAEGQATMMLLSASNTNNMINAPYVFCTTAQNLVVLGERKDGAHHNYGIDLSKHGITVIEPHSYCLTNRVAADGSNMVYLSVDGTEIGPMNNYFEGTATTNTTSDWVNGKDFVFSYMGTKNFPLKNTLSYVEVFEGRAHSYNAVVTAPTCTTDGYTTYTCTDCGHSYIDDMVTATGHSYTADVTAPGCASAGYTTYTCADCGDTYKGDTVPATGHSYISVVTKPTCTTEGYTTYTCSACGNSYQGNTVAATGHTYTSKVTAPTCTSSGYTTNTCACGHSYTSNQQSALGHNYTAKVTKPTCTDAGFTTYSCSRCDSSYVSDNISATGHSYVTKVTAPTCTAEGYTTYTCSACGDSYVADQVAALGHSYVNGYCSVCG
ncbi:MAG: hypothetical protein IJB11_00515, partial [Oscillospiraceae bacterium]|nr:hypothetical protein [Oscillospiraceae bacterium]